MLFALGSRRVIAMGTQPRMGRDRVIAGGCGCLLKKYVDDVTKINYKSVSVSIAPGGGGSAAPHLAAARERHARRPTAERPGTTLQQDRRHRTA
jgi:hypothetical protein